MIDWSAIALVLMERSDVPLLVLDQAGNVQVTNGPAARLLGATRDDVEGAPLLDALDPASHAATTRWVDQGLRGVFQQGHVLLAPRRGGRVRAKVELSLVGRGERQVLVVAIVSAEPQGVELAPTDCPELDYEIAIGASEFGALRRVRQLGSEAAGIAVGDRCYGVLRKRDAACDDCPVTRPPTEPWPRVAIRRCDTKPGFGVLTATAVGDDTVRVRLRVVDEHVLGALQQSRLHELAAQGGLTDRERTDFLALLRGLTLEEIADELALSPRTVKFHQRNLLDKLGAHSRFDLFRLACL